jgi:hypothetical protein
MMNEHRLMVIEDNAGGLWLYGRDSDGNTIHYGDLAYSNAGAGVTEIVAAWRDGIAGWEHGQDNDQPIDTDPRDYPGTRVVAYYDGTDLVLYPDSMGNAAQTYFGVPRE